VFDFLAEKKIKQEIQQKIKHAEMLKYKGLEGIK
jgi:hypothetical protein